MDMSEREQMHFYSAIANEPKKKTGKYINFKQFCWCILRMP